MKKVILLFLGIVVCLGVVGYFTVGRSMLSTWNQVHQDRQRTAPVISTQDNPKMTQTVPINTDVQKPFTFLMMGIDSQDLIGRTDTMILAVVNPQTKKITLLSIPRDTYVNLPGHGPNKINAAYAFGQVDGAIQEVQNFTGVPVDYYAIINFDGFMKMVDVIGGLNVNVEENITFNDRIEGSNFHLNKGLQHLNGYQVLNYSRFRYDAQGDFGRQKRQQEVIKDILNQSVSFKNVTKINQMLDVLGKNVKTDLNMSDLINLVGEVKDMSGNNIDSIQYDTTTGMESGISYVFISQDAQAKVHGQLLQLLNAN